MRHLDTLKRPQIQQKPLDPYALEPTAPHGSHCTTYKPVHCTLYTVHCTVTYKAAIRCYITICCVSVVLTLRPLAIEGVVLIFMQINSVINNCISRVSSISYITCAVPIGAVSDPINDRLRRYRPPTEWSLVSRKQRRP